MLKKTLAEMALALGFIVSIAQATEPPKVWTHLIYAEYDNGNNGYAEDFFAHLNTTPSDASVAVVAQIDSHSGASRWALTAGQGAQLVENLGAVNSAAPQTFVDFITWGLQYAPSEKVLLTVISPDNRYDQSLFPDSSASARMNYNDFAEAIVTAKAAAGREIDILNIEVPELGVWTKKPDLAVAALQSHSAASVYIFPSRSMGTYHASRITALMSQNLGGAQATLAALPMAQLLTEVVTSAYNDGYFGGYERSVQPALEFPWELMPLIQ